MVNNLKCDNCVFQTKCMARNKLKPFLEEARTDLGVELEFINCDNFTEFQDED